MTLVEAPVPLVIEESRCCWQRSEPPDHLTTDPPQVLLAAREESRADHLPTELPAREASEVEIQTELTGEF